MEEAMIAINAVSTRGDVGRSKACAYVLSLRKTMNPTLASAMKKPESRKYVFFARRMKYRAEQAAVSARKSGTLISILTPELFHSLFFISRLVFFLLQLVDQFDGILVLVEA
jgi:hypothetical protein